MQQGSGKNKGKASAKPILPARKLRDLKLAFSEFYLSLILLQNYQNLNHTGFRKILKKHDKVQYCCAIISRFNYVILCNIIT
jgi:SPX domain protein involved in polyphosphate accumulation